MATVTQQSIPFEPVTITLLTKTELVELQEIMEEAAESDISDSANDLANDLFKKIAPLLK